MSNRLILRTLNFRKDFNGLISLLDIAFEKEISAKGTNIQDELSGLKSILPLLKVLSLFSKRFKHTMDGYVFVNQDDKIIASVAISSSDSQGKKWEIAMVATHPDYRQQGLARKLIMKAIEHAKKHQGEICTLEVRADNIPAYQLYKSLNFIHVDSFTKLKLEPNDLSMIGSEFSKAYTIEQMKGNKETNLARYELAKRRTPEKVLIFNPIDKQRYQSSRFIKLIRPLAAKIMRIKVKAWVIWYKQKLVGTIVLQLSRAKKSAHLLTLVIDPDHMERISEPMLTHSLDILKNNDFSNQNLLIDIRSSDQCVINLLKRYGFIEYESEHILGLKLM